jgi:hypothetical protein
VMQTRAAVWLLGSESNEIRACAKGAVRSRAPQPCRCAHNEMHDCVRIVVAPLDG